MAFLIWLIAIVLGVAALGKLFEGEVVYGAALLTAGAALWLLVVV